MTTRFRYDSVDSSNSGGPAVFYTSPGFAPAFDITAGAKVRNLVHGTPTGVAEGGPSVGSDGVSNRDVLWGQFIGPPMAAQTISGTVKGQMSFRETAATLNARVQIVIRVISQDGLTFRGTLLAADSAALSSEFSTTKTNRKLPLAASSPATLTAVVCQKGDRLCIDVGARVHSTDSSSTFQGRSGDSGASDLTEDETDTGTNRAWIQFSADIDFLDVWGLGAVTISHPAIAVVSKERYALTGGVAFTHPLFMHDTTSTGNVSIRGPTLDVAGFVTVAASSAFAIGHPTFAGLAGLFAAQGSGGVSIDGPSFAGVGPDTLITNTVNQRRTAFGISMEEAVTGYYAQQDWTPKDLLDLIDRTKNFAADELGLAHDNAHSGHLYPATFSLRAPVTGHANYLQPSPVGWGWPEDELMNGLRDRGIKPLLWLQTTVGAAGPEPAIHQLWQQGNFDAELNGWRQRWRTWSGNARSGGVNARGRPKDSEVIVRVDHEHNGADFDWAIGTSYTYQGTVYHNTNSTFRQMCRHIRAQLDIGGGAPGIKLFYCPFASQGTGGHTTSMFDAYTGDDGTFGYVGFDVYADDPTGPSMRVLLASGIDKCIANSSLPIIIGETAIQKAGVTDAQRAAWLTGVGWTLSGAAGGVPWEHDNEHRVAIVSYFDVDNTVHGIDQTQSVYAAAVGLLTDTLPATNTIGHPKIKKPVLTGLGHVQTAGRGVPRISKPVLAGVGKVRLSGVANATIGKPTLLAVGAEAISIAEYRIAHPDISGVGIVSFSGAYAALTIGPPVLAGVGHSVPVVRGDGAVTISVRATLLDIVGFQRVAKVMRYSSLVYENELVNASFDPILSADWTRKGYAKDQPVYQLREDHETDELGGASTTIPGINPSSVALARFVSKPLLNNQNLYGQVYGVMQAYETQASVNARAELGVAVVGKLGSVKAVLARPNSLNSFGLIEEFPVDDVEGAARQFPIFISGPHVTNDPRDLATYRTQPGDRLYIEVGATTFSSGSGQVGIVFGGSSGNDLADAYGTDAPNDEPWLRFDVGPIFLSLWGTAGMGLDGPTIAATGAVRVAAGQGGVRFKHPILAAQAAPRVAGVGAIAFAHPLLSASDIPTPTGVVDMTIGPPVLGSVALTDDVLGSVSLTISANHPVGTIFVKGFFGVGALTIAKPTLDVFGMRRGETVINGYTIEIVPRVVDVEPLWRSPIWSRTVSPPIQGVFNPSDDNDFEVGGDPATDFHGELPSTRAVTPADAGDSSSRFAIFRLHNATDRDKHHMEEALNSTDYDWHRIMRRFKRRNPGKTKVPVVWTDVSKIEQEVDHDVYGWTSEDGTIHINENLQAIADQLGRRFLVEEVILSEIAHVVDRFGLSDDQRNEIKDLMGVPKSIPWRPQFPPTSWSQSRWQEFPAECFMDVFLKCCAPSIPITIKGFRFGVNGHKTQLRTLIQGHAQQDDGGGDGAVPPTISPAYIDTSNRVVTIDYPYDGPELPPGDYSVRYRIWDSKGEFSKWAYDHTLTISEGDPNAVIEQDWSAHLSAPFLAARVVLFNLDRPAHDEDAEQVVHPGNGEYSRGPGEIVAIIDDPSNLGASGYDSTPGELHFTLVNSHPQLSLCLPFQTHYALQQRDRFGHWVDVRDAQGMLTDIDAGDEDTIVYGMNYIGMLSLSVESAKQPDGDVDAPIDSNPDTVNGDAVSQPNARGSKYIEKEISFIIRNQLERAIADDDSPIGWIKLDGDNDVDPMPEPITIYAAFVERLTFIRGLMDSYAAGQGVNSRVWVGRDLSDHGNFRFKVFEDSGQERPELRLEYGSMLQGFELIPFGEFAVKVHGIGRRALSVKPMYEGKIASGVDPQTYGNIAKVAVWNDIADQADLQRRTLQKAAEYARVGKNVALALRVRGIDALADWNINDSIPVAVERGPIDSRYWSPDEIGLTWWTIKGWQWLVSPDGHDELRWFVAPRIDNTKPLPDTDHPLLAFTAQHTTPEWQPTGPIDNGDGGGEEQVYLLGIDSDVYNKPGALVDDLRDAGGDFGITKLTQGTYFDYTTAGNHPPATKRAEQIKSKGMVPGFYHFLTRVEKKDGSGDAVAFNSGRHQCDYFVARLPNKVPEGYIIALDVESNPGAQPFTGPDGKTYHPSSGGPKKEEIRDFLVRWFQLFPNHPIFVYSNLGEWRSDLDLPSISPLIFKWNASRQDQPRRFPAVDPSTIDMTTYAWGGLPVLSIIEQYGYVVFPDYEHVLDANVFRGTRDDLRKYAVSNGLAPVEPPEDHPKTVQGYNDTMDVAIVVAPTLDPDTGVGGANYDEGVARAQADLARFAEEHKLETNGG